MIFLAEILLTNRVVCWWSGTASRKTGRLVGFQETKSSRGPAPPRTTIATKPAALGSRRLLHQQSEESGCHCVQYLDHGGSGSGVQDLEVQFLGSVSSTGMKRRHLGCGAKGLSPHEMSRRSESIDEFRDRLSSDPGVRAKDKVGDEVGFGLACNGPGTAASAGRPIRSTNPTGPAIRCQ
jgi:hypothetical protein